MVNSAQMTGLPPLIYSAENAPAYWFLGILWIVLIDGEQTDGRYSLMGQHKLISYPR